MAIQGGLVTYRRTRGYDLVRVVTIANPERYRDEVVGIVRNRLTGDEEVLVATVEPQAPHLITWITGGLHPRRWPPWG